MIDTEQIKHRLETWKAIEENKCLSCDREVKGAAILCGGDFCEEKWKERRPMIDQENEGLCHNPLCDQEEWPSEMIGHQCDCGGYIWHKDEYNNTEEERMEQ